MKRKRARSAPKGETGGRRRWLIPGVVLATLGAVATVGVVSTRQSGFAPGARETASALPPAPAPLIPAAQGPPDPRAELPPIPAGPQVLPRPPLVVQAIYEFAARHPEVLRYVPCFCGCERMGHGSNHDCFVSRRDPAGRVTWDAHGVG